MIKSAVHIIITTFDLMYMYNFTNPAFDFQKPINVMLQFYVVAYLYCSFHTDHTHRRHTHRSIKAVIDRVYGAAM